MWACVSSGACLRNRQFFCSSTPPPRSYTPHRSMPAHITTNNNNPIAVATTTATAISTNTNSTPPPLMSHHQHRHRLHLHKSHKLQHPVALPCHMQAQHSLSHACMTLSVICMHRVLCHPSTCLNTFLPPPFPQTNLSSAPSQEPLLQPVAPSQEPLLQPVAPSQAIGKKLHPSNAQQQQQQQGSGGSSSSMSSSKVDSLSTYQAGAQAADQGQSMASKSETEYDSTLVRGGEGHVVARGEVVGTKEVDLIKAPRLKRALTHVRTHSQMHTRTHTPPPAPSLLRSCSRS